MVVPFACAGRRLVLTSAGPDVWLNRRILASRALVGIGLISYPPYLWHQPLLIFSKLIVDSGYALGNRGEIAVAMAAIGTASVLSWATYRFVEKPIRFSLGLRSPFPVIALVAAMVEWQFSPQPGFRSSNPDWMTLAVREIERAKKDFEFTANWKMLPTTANTIQSQSPHAALFVGDSHMEHYFPRARAAIQADPLLATAVFATSGTCAPLPGMNRAEPDFQCDAFYDFWFSLAREPRFETVAISALWDIYVSPATVPPETFRDTPPRIPISTRRGKGWSGTSCNCARPASAS